MIPFFLIYGILVLLCLAAGVLLLCRFPRCPRSSRRSRRRVSVIIPARNEETNLEHLLPSLTAQRPSAYEIIVVDDASDDHTRRTARRYGARLISAGRRPPGWHGKTWACWRGAARARGSALLFLDADTRLEPGGLAAMDEAQRNSGGVISLQPYHQMETGPERLSLFFNIVLMAGMNAFGACEPLRQPRGAFGPCLLITKRDYKRIGGHRAVRGEVLEDMTMGRLLREARIPLRLFAGRGTIRFRMYADGLRSVIDGWTKSIAVGAAKTNAVTMLLINLWLSGAFLAAAAWGSLILWPGSAALAFSLCLYFAYAVYLYITGRRIGNFGVWPALWFPLEAVFFVMVFCRSVYLVRIKRAVTWKGKTIDLA